MASYWHNPTPGRFMMIHACVPWRFSLMCVCVCVCVCVCAKICEDAFACVKRTPMWVIVSHGFSWGISVQLWLNPLQPRMCIAGSNEFDSLGSSGTGRSSGPLRVLKGKARLRAFSLTSALALLNLKWHMQKASKLQSFSKIQHSCSWCCFMIHLLLLIL